MTLPSLPRWRRAALVALLAGTAPAIACAPAWADETFAIAPQPLGAALIAFSEATGLQLLAPRSLVGDLNSPGVSGPMTNDAALDALLAGTGLVGQIAGGTISVAPPGAATPGDGAMLLDTITVDGIGATELSDSYVSDIPTGTATGLPLTIRETPQSMSVVTQQEMRDRRDQTLEQTLSHTPGIVASQGYGEGRWGFYARGSEIDNLQFDGLPIPSHWWGREFTIGNMVVYDRVEVVRGAAGLVQGAGNPSASVNLVRKRPLSFPQLTTETAFGLAGNASVTVDATKPLNAEGTIRGRVVGYGLAGDTETDAQSHNTGVAYGALDIDLTDRTTLGLGASYQKDRINGYSWGGFWAEPDGTLIDFSPSDQPALDWEYLDREQFVGYADLTHDLGGGWGLRGALRWSRGEGVEFSSYARWSPESTLDRVGWRYDVSMDEIAGDLAVSGPVRLFDREHDLVFGLNASRAELSYWGSNAYSFDIPDPTRVDPFAHPEPVTDDATLDSATDVNTQWGLYAAARLTLTDRAKAVVGGRLSWFEQTSNWNDLIWNSSGGSSYSEDARFTPYAGLLYDIDETWTVYASYTEIFMPQDYRGPDGPLDPVTGSNVEIGVKAGWRDDRLLFTAALFDTNRDGLPEVIPGMTGCGTAFDPCYRPAERVNSRGAEFEISGAITDRWNLALGYTYARTEYAEGPSEGEPYSPWTAPEQVARLTTSYALPGQFEGLTLGGGIRAQSRVWRDASDWSSGLPFSMEQEGYAVVDLMARYEMSDRLELQVNVDNLFDRSYYSAIAQPSSANFMGDPRTISLSLRQTF